MEKALLEVRNLKKYYSLKKDWLGRSKGHVKAVENISFSIRDGETFGLVGESGCGKSTAGRTILGLMPATEGEVIYQGKTLRTLSKEELRLTRKNMQMIFQDPYASLNPRMTVFDILEEPLRAHHIGEKQDRRKKIEEILEVVGLTKRHINRYTHEFSGGQRQRIVIARSLILQPKFIVADEPVSALDVSIQSQILNLMQDLQEQFQLTYLFISHDLSVVRHLCNRVGVMYLGNLVEVSDVGTLFNEPLHPYTKMLLSAIPIPDPLAKRERIMLQGDLPSPANPPSGCPFSTRCPDVKDICRQVKPELKSMTGEARQIACHLYEA
ncbi:dipeptide ABC transporter ATP-binding protein [Brevibacillus fluminis]|uniref:Dipeptide ABC transporter ATP-binding protein n=1 Tax=Brevibacillus fluminis TaxID=511487 RepID=A0A3M8DHX5_9BACL|nr:dipeptide ABC transporter ATP-binding protein [Brevibacillus fluminis]RNB87702.1 dipeptide ABC transporter ATP-binding protein [Brevibacillus fluminis]